MPYGVYVTTVNPGPIRTGFFDQADPDGTYLKSSTVFYWNQMLSRKRLLRPLEKQTRAQSPSLAQSSPQILYPLSQVSR